MAITGANALAATDSHFDPAEFDEAIRSHGTPVTWRKGTTCPCFDPMTGHAQIDCPYCEHGFGMLWDDGVPITILAPGRQRNDNYDVTGMWMNGIVMLTFVSTVTPAHLDMVELLAAEMVVNRELHVRGDTNKVGRSTERVRFRKVVMPEGAFAIVGVELQTYQPLTDFLIDADGVIVWADGAGPPEGTQYSVRYLARPSYVIISPQSRDEGGGTKLPMKCLAQRLDFFNRAAVGEATVA